MFNQWTNESSSRGPSSAGTAGRLSQQVSEAARQTAETSYWKGYKDIQIKALSGPTW